MSNGKSEGATTQQPTYRDIEITFPHIDDGTLADELEEIVRNQDELDLDGKQMLIYNARIDKSEITAEIGVKVDDE